MLQGVEGIPFGIDVRVSKGAVSYGRDEVNRNLGQTGTVQESFDALKEVIHNTLDMSDSGGI